MRFRSTLILALVFAALGAYLYVVEFERAAREGKKKTLVEFDPDAVRSVTLAYPDREIALERGDDGWRLTAPVAAPADETGVKNLIDAIADCEVKKTLDEVPSDLAPFALDQPHVTIRVALNDRDLPVIRVGKTSPVGFSTYVQRADDPKVHLTSSAFHSSTDKQANDLRDKQIVKFNDDDVRRIAVQGTDRDLLLSHGDSTWKLDRPASYPADATTVRSFLSTLRSMRAVDFAAEHDPDLAPYGFAQPRLTITLFVGPDEDQKQIVLGAENEKKEIYVKTASRPTIYTVSDWVYRDLNKTVNDFRDKSLFTFDADAARQVEVERGEGRLVLKRGEDQTWTLEGVEGTPTGSRVDQFITDLRDLKGYEIAADAPEDLARYGLAPPTLSITVRGAEGKPLGTARLGAYSPNPPATEYTAMRDDEPSVLHVREYLFSRVDKTASDFLPEPTATASPAGTPGASLNGEDDRSEELADPHAGG